MKIKNKKFTDVAKYTDANTGEQGDVISALRKVQDVGYIPTHRVVTSTGQMSKSFVDGGKRGQKKLLKQKNNL